MAPEQIEVMAGSNDMHNGLDYYEADKLIVHENYDDPLFANDIGLIRLKNPIEFNEKIQPIKLATEELTEDTTLQLSGWGSLSVRLALEFRINLRFITS